MKTSDQHRHDQNKMKPNKPLMSRRDMLRTLGLSGGALFGLGVFRANPALGQVAGDPPELYLETFPTSPFILEPFKDELPIPAPLKPLTDSELQNRWNNMPQRNYQDSDQGIHQIWPSNTAAGLYLPQPLIYDIKLKVGEHRFTTSRVLPIDKDGDPVRRLPSGAPVGLATNGTAILPPSTIYGFNGTFLGTMIYATYGQPVLVRFQNYLADNPYNCDRQDFGDPECKLLIHLHNGHTSPESDGNPFHRHGGYWPSQTGGPGQWCDNLYLNYPAGGDSREMQSFMWLHDHTHGFTGANVYKGMVGLYPIYDPVSDPGDERQGCRLPGVAKFLGTGKKGPIDYNQPIKFDLPLTLYDCSLDDGDTPHKDAHSGTGETRPEWWGKTFFKHFPSKGFVGDIFTVNGTAYPFLEVKRRRYRLRFLNASVARCYDLKLMQGSVEAAPGQKGQYNMTRIIDGAGNVTLDAQQCMIFTQIATEGGLLPHPILRDSFELWPAKRREVIVDFSKYMDGTPTTKGDVIYLVNKLKMEDGRKPDDGQFTEDDNGNIVVNPDFDPTYAVPLLKFVIGNDAVDNSVDPLDYDNLVDGKATLRMVTQRNTGDSVPALRMRALPRLPRNFKGVPVRRFELKRDDRYGGEIEWLINGHAFDMADPNGMFPQAITKQGRPELWVIENGSGGWVHPMHIHMEEHRVISRNGVPVGSANADPRHVDDIGREDTVALDPSEEVMIYRDFRTFKGRFVAHCHNLVHEDHSMMFGWEVS